MILLKEKTIKYLFGGAVEKTMAPHSSILAWKIPWMEEPGRLQSMGSLRVGHDWATSLSLFTFMHSRKWQPTPVFLPGESQDGVTQSRTRLKWLSSSSSWWSRLCRYVCTRHISHQYMKVLTWYYFWHSCFIHCLMWSLKGSTSIFY